VARYLDLPDSISADISVSDPDIIGPYCRDWTGRVRGTTDLLVRPRTHFEVVQLLEQIKRQHQHVQVQGGNTSLAGGSVPLDGEILLTTERLTQLVIEPDTMTATAGAGVTLAQLQTEIARFGLSFGVDIASRGSATLGGMTATNAGGIHVLRYGSMVDNIVGLTCVFGDGSTIDPHSPLIKDATGPSLTRFLVGSEGIFGIITSITLRLFASPRQRVVALTPLASIDEGVELAGKLRRLLPEIDAIEYLGPETIGLASIDPPWNVSPGGALLVEALMDAPSLADQLESLDTEQGWILAEESWRMTELWHWRESIPEWVSKIGEPLKLDLSVPIKRVGELYQTAHAIAGDAGVACYCFGHLGDGNLHVNLVGDDLLLERAAKSLYAAVVQLEGSVSAEHGIGTLKKEALQLMRSPSELARLGTLIETFNPGRVINPNIMLNTNKGDLGD